MFIDEVEIDVAGGKGGDGIVSFGKMMHSGPDGGNGGRGGDVYFKGVSDLTALAQFSRKKDFEADPGDPGGKNKRTGKDADDLTISIPVGTSVIDRNTNKILFEMLNDEETVLVARGGDGGRGNWEFRGPTRTTPKFAEKGKPGEKLRLKLVLKLIADFGLIGLPNMGKSSLLNELTNAKAKTANYPFTTLSPNLGVLDNKVLADVPGLIKGASEGKGLGISFLKHIRKVGTLLHCISAETLDPVGDYKIIRQELETYSKTLSQKPEIILLTKSDLVDASAVKKISSKFKNNEVLPVSIYDFTSIEKLSKIIRGK